MKRLIIPTFLLAGLWACFGQAEQLPAPKTKQANYEIRNLIGYFPEPLGFKRILADSSSFAHYLRHVPLKKKGSKVLYYDGNTKDDTDVYSAVVDLPIGKRDLHQCADAVMRLRAEYLWKHKRYNEIGFKFENGFDMRYAKWRQGHRIRVKGNKVWWVKTASLDTSYKNFWKYLEMVFAYAGTASLSRELKSVPMDSMQIGDVLIRGGHPGHSAIIMDMAVNAKTGKKCFLIAQSYMPAQETQILRNPQDANGGSWYPLNNESWLVTPEYTFGNDELKRFP